MSSYTKIEWKLRLNILYVLLIILLITNFLLQFLFNVLFGMLCAHFHDDKKYYPFYAKNKLEQKPCVFEECQLQLKNKKGIIITGKKSCQINRSLNEVYIIISFQHCIIPLRKILYQYKFLVDMKYIQVLLWYPRAILIN